MAIPIEISAAVAIRMGAARRPGAASVPPLVTPLEAGSASPGGLSLPAGLEPTAIAERVAACDVLPGTVSVDGVGTYAVEAVPPEARRPRLAGVIALVTGSAQGLGQGIAVELAREGAHVIVADLNVAGAEAAAASLREQFGSQAGQGIAMDVADLASSRAACEATVRRFGGLDMLVANAGVLKAGGIEELDASAFEFVTRVNYTGYFLCVKAAVPIMRLQHCLNAAHGMDIIQVNSKSGLEGSNRNFAYAGGKFGGIGLTQSFALELVADGIKVNAVCPGNYLDGPLWSDPEKGLFVQYLRSGKVPGAKTVDDVRAFYMSKVPLNRGVQPVDIARAIFYLREQTYETGQAVPVTGGQVMLS